MKQFSDNYMILKNCFTNVRFVHVIIFLITTSVYVPNNGGLGTSLPYNLLFIAWLGLTIINLVRYRLLSNPAPKYQPLLIIGATLLVLPWLMQMKGNQGVWVLLAGILFWCILGKLTLDAQHKKFLLVALFFFALVQSIMGLMQTFLPEMAFRVMEYNWLKNHGRPYGVFQQFNLFSSIVATGCACCFLLYLTTEDKRNEYCYLAALGFFSFVLTIGQSRTGQVGVLASFIFTTLTMGRFYTKRSLTSALVMIFMAIVGWYITHHLPISVDKQMLLLDRDYSGSNHERWYILNITWHMIMEKPWFGWGYGTFEYSFSRWVLSHPEMGYQYSSIVTHPHNELLYAWFQGGIVPLIGVLTLLVGWMKITFSARKEGKVQACYPLMLFPILAHVCLEYPFYQSFIHFGVFLTLLRLCVIDNKIEHCKRKSITVFGAILYSIAGVSLIFYSIIGLYANNEMTFFERNGLREFPDAYPWYFETQPSRAYFDSMVALLMSYNKTHDETKLRNFMFRSNKWILKHNDRNIWQSRILIAKHWKDNVQEHYMQQNYNQLFPQAPLKERKG